MATQDIVLTRTIDAPREAVWNAWTDPDLVVLWWGPAGFTCHSAIIELREGGRWVWNMRAPETMGGFDMYTAGRYTRIVPYEVIEFTQWLADEQGNPIDPVALGMPPDFPAEIRCALTFTDAAGGTRLTATEYDWTAGEQRELSESGLSECLDKLESLLRESIAR